MYSFIPSTPTRHGQKSSSVRFDGQAKPCPPTKAKAPNYLSFEVHAHVPGYQPTPRTNADAIQVKKIFQVPSSHTDTASSKSVGVPKYLNVLHRDA